VTKYRLVFAPGRNSSQPYIVESCTNVDDPYIPAVWYTMSTWDNLKDGMVSLQSYCYQGVVIAEGT
jgi:hypothetical protein